MKKRIGLLILIITSVVGCAPKLVTYPPTDNSWVLSRIQKLPEHEIKAATIKSWQIYQTEMYPIFCKLHQQNESSINPVLLSVLSLSFSSPVSLSDVKLAKTSNILFFKANVELKNTIAKYSSEKYFKNTDNFCNKMLQLSELLSQLLNITEGYVTASEEWNLSFLTKENETIFNSLAVKTYELGRELEKDTDILLQEWEAI